MKYTKALTTILFFTLFLSTVSADTVSPYKNERTISNQERTIEEVSLTNESENSIYIRPKVYSYNPKTQEITDKQSYIFVRTDIDDFKVEANNILNLGYEIVPVSNMQPGTYFNLIVLEKTSDSATSKRTNPVNITDSLSHLVVLHITEAGVLGITSDFALVSLEIKDNGIPFLKPTVVKYTYQNTTNYVLTPLGEIQIYNQKGAYPPVYIKINEDGEKLYPGDIREGEFEVEEFDISDIFNQRTIVGRFYNGIDDSYIIKEIYQQPNYLLISAVGGTIILIGILIKAVFSKSKKKTA